jgi:hypothetical protein
MDIIRTKEALFTFLAVFFEINSFEFYYGFITLSYMELGILETQVGVFFAVQAFSQFVYSILFTKVEHLLPRKLGTFISIFCNSLIFIFMSRTDFLNIPDTW